MPTAPPTVGADLPRLTSLRAFAAASVFMFHLSRDTSFGIGGLTFLHGYVGVGFFFILSGFVLTWSTRPGTPARTFWRRRFARVYPSHLVMLLVAVIAPVLVHQRSWAAFVTNLFLVQAWFPQWPIAFGMNAVSWSLSCEAFFYLCTPFVLAALQSRSNRFVTSVLLGWVTVTAVAGLLLVHSGQDIYAFTNPAVRSGEFALGVFCAVAVQRSWVRRVPLAVGVAAVVLAWWLSGGKLHPQTATDLLFAVPFALLVLAAATTDLQGRTGLLTARPLVYAGKVSFCFYLVHELLLLNIGSRLGGAGPGITTRLALSTAMLVLAFAVAAGLHHLVELPAQRRLRGAARSVVRSST